MVTITVAGTEALFEPHGWSIVWTFRRRIVVPLTAIRLVRRVPRDFTAGWWRGWRLPGTHIPGVITAGSYYRDGEWDFWDVRGKGGRAIEVQLAGHRYSRLIVDVEDPAREVARLQAAAGSSSA